VRPPGRWAEDSLEYRFSDETLLIQALTHRSASRDNNERLEYLGDSILNFRVARRLFDEWPGANEGELSRARAALVNKRVLAEIGRRIGIDEVLILGAGELRSGGAQRSSALADAVEAVIGAVLLDGGVEPACDLIDRLLAQDFSSLTSLEELKDPKTRLQEWLQGRGQALPEYRIEEISGDDHAREFVVGCAVPSRDLLVSGTGGSRRAAEQDAAARVLEKLERDG